MNKKFILPIALLTLVSLVMLVSASMTKSNYLDYGTRYNSYDVGFFLQPGWNLILNPIAGTIAENSEIQLSDLKYTYWYSALDKKYLQIFPNDANFISYMTSKRAGEGTDLFNSYKFSSVWVYVEKQGTLRYRVGDSKGATITNNFKLYSGWNFVYRSPDFDEEDTLNTLKGTCNIEKAYLWNNNLLGKEGTWQPLDLNEWLQRMDLPSNDNGKGILIRVSDSCVFGKGASGGNPPQIPDDISQIPNDISKCTDSDGGMNYYVKGDIRNIDGGGSDFCYNLTVLTELYCNLSSPNSSPRYVSSIDYTCPKGCLNGACIP
jgi:hypothetical protein